ncbi:MAG TPA: hypothetical protein VD969_19675 [Symbiobacteriaceae bacterium]|nr:hypothetical protein [Symbiobacteriaceae bacterium]
MEPNDEAPEAEAKVDQDPAVDAASMFENGVGAWDMDDMYVVAARSEEEAIAFFKGETAGAEIPEGYPIQIADLDVHNVALMDENEKPTGEVITFREAIRAQHKVPDFLCQSDC